MIHFDHEVELLEDLTGARPEVAGGAAIVADPARWVMAVGNRVEDRVAVAAVGRAVVAGKAEGGRVAEVVAVAEAVVEVGRGFGGGGASFYDASVFGGAMS